MMIFKQSEGTSARRRILLYLVDSTDNLTPKTGVTVAAGDIKISKNGAAEGNHAGTFTEVGNGVYYYEFTASELDTLGYVSFRLAKSGVRTFVKESQVVAIDLNDAASLGLAFSELSQGAPSANPTLAQAIMLLYMALRNRAQSTSTEQRIMNDVGTVICKATLSDDGTTFQKDEFVSGP